MITLNLIGFDKYIERIKKAEKDIQVETAAEIQLAGIEFRDGAKRDLVRQGATQEVF